MDDGYAPTKPGPAGVGPAGLQRARLAAPEFHELTDFSPQLIWTCLAEGPCDYVSGSWVEYVGVPEAELLGHGWLAQIHPEDRARFEKDIGAMIERAVPLDVNLRIRRADGVHRWFRTCAVPLPVPNGSIAKWCGSSTAIDERSSLFQHMLEGYARLRLVRDPGGPIDAVYLDVNESHRRVTGLSNVIGRRVTQVVPGIEASNPELLALCERVVATGTTERLETQVAALGRWFEIAVYRSGHDEFVVVLEDITGRKAAEHALSESEDRYRAVVESASEAIVTIERNSRIIRFANNSIERILGYSAAELVGKELTTLMPERYRDRHRDAVARYAETGVKSLDWRGTPVVGLHKDGREIPLEVSYGEYLKDGQLHIVGVMRDVTALRHAERDLRLFRTLIDRSNDGVEIIDPESGRFLDVNERTCLELGYTREELLALGPLDIDPGMDPVTFASKLSALRKSGILRFETTHRRKDGSIFPVEVSVSLVQLEREYAIAIVRDMTEVKDLQRRFLHAQKMEAVGRLAGGIAHDFNNVLSVILSYSALIEAELKPEEPLRADITEISTAAKRAAALTRQLLAFSRQQVLEPEVLDLNESLAGMEKMLARLLGADLELTLLPAKGLWAVEADPGQIEQVLMNLAVNARDAMSNGGKLTIETKNVELDEAHAHARDGVVPGSYALIAVTDTGTGMDAETQARIFEPFFTTKREGKGTGLGLSTVFGIVEQSGGHVSVDSEVGSGTTFNVYLPRVGGTARPVPSVGPAPEARVAGATILLVEDDDQLGAVAASILRRHGHVVLMARNGGEALLICEQHGAKIDLLLTDVVMPLMSGRQLAERLSELRPEMKVLFMSGYTDDAILHHGILDSGVSFLQKPFTPASLSKRVQDVLWGGPSGRPQPR